VAESTSQLVTMYLVDLQADSLLYTCGPIALSCVDDDDRGRSDNGQWSDELSTATSVINSLNGTCCMQSIWHGIYTGTCWRCQ